MQKMTVEKLYTYYKAHPNISTDTRNIKLDSIFFALKGDNFNGNEFAHQALEKGATFAVVDEEKYCISEKYLLVEDVLESLQQLAKYHRNQLKIPFIGITGSNGKTTTKELIHAVLSQKYKTLATHGNLNNHIGVPLTLLSIREEHQMAVIEMGANHMKEIEFLSSICSPDFGIITNIGKAHLEGFGSEENIAKGKSELYTHIKQKAGLLFVNADDSKVMQLSEGNKRICYGSANSSDFIAEYKGSEPFVCLQLNSLTSKPIVNSSIIGKYNFDNCVAAACIGNYFGVDETAIVHALESYVPSNNRSQVMQKGSNTILMDAYNANPSSMEVALANFSSMKSEKKLAILGDMLELGSESELEHQHIADKALASKNTRVILIGPNFQKIKTSASILHFESTAAAGAYLSEQQFKDFTVLIKGSRGMKLEQLLESFSN